MDEYETYQTPLSRSVTFVYHPIIVSPCHQSLCKQRNGPPIFPSCEWQVSRLDTARFPTSGPQNRFHTWRKLWLNLAIAEKNLGLPISGEAIEQMMENLVRSLYLLAWIYYSHLASHSILLQINSKSQRTKKRKDVMTLWPTYIHLVRSPLQLLASSSSFFHAFRPVFQLLNLCRTQFRSHVVLCHGVCLFCCLSDPGFSKRILFSQQRGSDFYPDGTNLSPSFTCGSHLPSLYICGPVSCTANPWIHSFSACPVDHSG